MINIIKASEYKTKLKATIQATGRLGFTEETSDKLDFSTQKYIKFAQDDADSAMYMIVTDIDDNDAFKVCTSGKYYYLAAYSGDTRSPIPVISVHSVGNHQYRRQS